MHEASDTQFAAAFWPIENLPSSRTVNDVLRIERECNPRPGFTLNRYYGPTPTTFACTDSAIEGYQPYTLRLTINDIPY